MMDFLYFPEDKTEYIPALIWLGLVIIVSYIVYRIIKAYSKNQEEKMKEFEEAVLKRMERERQDESRGEY